MANGLKLFQIHTMHLHDNSVEQLTKFVQHFQCNTLHIIRSNNSMKNSISCAVLRLHSFRSTGDGGANEWWSAFWANSNIVKTQFQVSKHLCYDNSIGTVYAIHVSCRPVDVWEFHKNNSF